MVNFETNRQNPTENHMDEEEKYVEEKKALLDANT